jgi:hypothetical protein
MGCDQRKFRLKHNFFIDDCQFSAPTYTTPGDDPEPTKAPTLKPETAPRGSNGDTKASDDAMIYGIIGAVVTVVLRVGNKTHFKKNCLVLLSFDVFWGRHTKFCYLLRFSSVLAGIEWAGRIDLNQQRPYDSSLTSDMRVSDIQFLLHSVVIFLLLILEFHISNSSLSIVFSCCAVKHTREHATSANFESRGNSSLLPFQKSESDIFGKELHRLRFEQRDSIADLLSLLPSDESKRSLTGARR